VPWKNGLPESALQTSLETLDAVEA
jgi:hypothetical protein